MAGPLDGLIGKRRDEGQRVDPAGPQRRRHRGRVHVGVNDGHAEGERVLAGDFGDNRPAPGHVRRRAGAAGRAYDHRHAQPQAFDEHELQIALDQRTIGERAAAAQVVRSWIGRAGVAGDQVRPPLDAAAERCLREAVSQDGRRRQDAELVAGTHSSLLKAKKEKHHGDTENSFPSCGYRLFSTARIRSCSFFTIVKPSSNPMPGLASMTSGRAAIARCTQHCAETSVSLHVPPW